MTEPKTVPEMLDAAQTGEEFGAVIGCRSAPRLGGSAMTAISAFIGAGILAAVAILSYFSGYLVELQRRKAKK